MVVKIFFCKRWYYTTVKKLYFQVW